MLSGLMGFMIFDPPITEVNFKLQKKISIKKEYLVNNTSNWRNSKIDVVERMEHPNLN